MSTQVKVPATVVAGLVVLELYGRGLLLDLFSVLALVGLAALVSTAVVRRPSDVEGDSE
jgi:hypothetical protein